MASSGAAVRQVQIGKRLSYLLRHGAITEGLIMQTDGYVLLSDVVHSIGAPRDKIVQVALENDKQRFTVSNFGGKEYIRANQGHSIPVPDLELKIIGSLDDLPSAPDEDVSTTATDSSKRMIVHGTYFDSLESIRANGLSRMSRNHIHFAIGLPGASHVISGMRKSCDVLIFIDIQQAIADGIKFFISPNNVVLCPGDVDGFLKPKYFEAVTNVDLIPIH